MGWNAGRAYRDVYYLPTDDLADGEYQISVGWYDAASGARLSLGRGRRFLHAGFSADRGGDWNRKVIGRFELARYCACL